jgi:hypothetical protein
VHGALGSKAAGDAVVDRIFRQNTTSPNFISVLLGRSDDPDERYPGQITVGEIIPDHENVTAQPKIAVTPVSSKSLNSQHWQVLVDPDGFIGPDDKPIDFNTHVTSTKTKSQLTAIFDTGFSLPQVPKWV